MIPIHQLPEAPPPPNEPPPLENDELDEERLDEKLLRDDDEELEYVRDELDIREASFVSGPPPWRCSLEIWRMMAYTTRPTRISGASTIKQVNPRNAIATSGCSRGSAGRLVSRRGASAPPSIRLRQRFDTGVDAFGVPALAKPRDNLLANYAARNGIGDRSLQAVSDLHAHLAIVAKDEEHQPVVLLLMMPHACAARTVKSSSGSPPREGIV